MLVQVGTIVRAHGVQGEVKVRPDTDDPARVVGLTVVFVGESSTVSGERDVVSCRIQESRHGQTILLRLAGVTSRESADALRGALVFAREDDLPGLDDDEYYLDELVGMHVVEDDGRDLGIVKEVLELPAHPVLLLEVDGRDVLIPAVSPFITHVDAQSGSIKVDLPDGLIDQY